MAGRQKLMSQLLLTPPPAGLYRGLSSARPPPAQGTAPPTPPTASPAPPSPASLPIPPPPGSPAGPPPATPKAPHVSEMDPAMREMERDMNATSRKRVPPAPSSELGRRSPPPPSPFSAKDPVGEAPVSELKGPAEGSATTTTPPSRSSVPPTEAAAPPQPKPTSGNSEASACSQSATTSPVPKPEAPLEAPPLGREAASTTSISTESGVVTPTPADPAPVPTSPKPVLTTSADHASVLALSSEAVLADSKEAELAHLKEAVQAPVARGPLGISLDLSPAGLVQFSQERGHGAGEDQEGYRNRHSQAVSDSEFITNAMLQAEEFHKKEVERLMALAGSNEEKLEKVRRVAQASAERMQRQLKEHQLLAKESRLAEVKLTEKKVSLHAREAWVQERKDRLSKLDTIRIQVGALSQVHEARAAQQASSRGNHALTLGLVGLATALDQGKPLAPHVSALAAGSTEEPLIQMVLSSFPEDAVTNGIPTRSQLEYQLRSMKLSVAAMAYFPSGSGGILSHLMASIAVRMKIDETEAVQHLAEEDGGLPAALAQAEHSLKEGKLTDAAHAISKAAEGTAAAAAVKQWVASARARASADQAVQMLRSHAASLAASMSL
eukprot:gene16270-22450_t